MLTISKYKHLTLFPLLASVVLGLGLTLKYFSVQYYIIGVIQIQVQKMIDIGLGVEMNLEVGLEVREDQENLVLIATSPTMIFLTVRN